MTLWFLAQGTRPTNDDTPSSDVPRPCISHTLTKNRLYIRYASIYLKIYNNQPKERACLYTKIISLKLVIKLDR